MASTTWQIQGDYFETCNCDYLCPCISSNATALPTKGTCNFAMVFHIDQGRYGNLALDGLTFAMVGYVPGALIQGNWSVGLILDDKASPEQQQALAAVASGQAGGPMAAFSPLLGTFLGTEVRPIKYGQRGLTRSVSIPGVLDQSAEGVTGAVHTDEPLYLDNTMHPANARLALAKATRSHLHAFGLNWDDEGGKNNGHFAPFSWQAG